MLAFYVPLLVASLLSGALAIPAFSIVAQGASEIEVLDLPESFDMTHPALDIGKQLELLAANPNAELPRLPADLPIKIFKVNSPGLKPTKAVDGAANPNTLYYCQSNTANWWDAQNAANSLKGLGDSWCCQTSSNKPCTIMSKIGNAVTAICSPPKRCVKCGVVGATYLTLINVCKSGNYVAGYAVFPGFADLVLYKV